MTREEAIKIIDCYDIGFYDLSGEKIPADKLAEAFDLAIEALSADTVSRESYIKAVGYVEWLEKLIVDSETFEWLCEDTNDREWCEKNCNYSSIQAECLRHLYKDKPSAEAVPQLKQTDTLIIADALRYLAKDTERHLADRTRADALRQQFLKYGASMCHSAEAVQGEWILVKGSNGKDYHKCSKCLHIQEITGVKNYCAVCGARMKGGD